MYSPLILESLKFFDETNAVVKNIGDHVSKELWKVLAGHLMIIYYEARSKGKSKCDRQRTSWNSNSGVRAMSILTFLLGAVFISLSGVMSPGPMTAVTIGKGNESPHAGAFIAIGHGIAEFPLMISIFYGFGHLLDLRYVRPTVAFVGGLFLFAMGISMFRSVRIEVCPGYRYTRSPMIAGVLLSLGNPYFLIWWATVGAVLILQSTSFGMPVFLVFALLHWLCDFSWYYFLSALSFRSRQFFGKGFQRVVFAICGVVLLFFSGKFIADALRSVM